VTFDAMKLEVTGQPVPMAVEVMTAFAFGAAQFALSDSGDLVYIPRPPKDYSTTVISVDRDGRIEPLIETERPFVDLRLSPDGGTLALQIGGAMETIWLYEIARGTMTRWNSEWDNLTPVWAPSGQEIAFVSARPERWSLFKRPVHGKGEAELLATGGKIPTSWSPDGAVLLFEEDRLETGTDIWLLPLSGERRPEPFLNGRGSEMSAAYSPNGKWVAYQSDETGRFEIYVRRFPDDGVLRAVSTGGGDHPIWNPTGKELFYSSGERMMAVAVETGDELVLGRPKVLFERRRTASEPFAVTPDGQRFLALDESVAEAAPTHLVLVQNFAEELKRLAPPRN
jgi:Tol biopolymer transport system component